MGSWFSTPDESDFAAALKRVKRLAAIPMPRTRQEIDAYLIRMLANRVLQYYNSSQPGAKFQYLDEPSADIKAACVCFRRDLWYHVGFSAIRKDDCNAQRFFAELRFDPRSDMLIIETCTILEEPLCRFRSSCAFCPEESNILHPSDDAELKCGKEGHEKEFIRERCARGGPGVEFFSQSDMLKIPFALGGGIPRYRLVDQP